MRKQSMSLLPFVLGASMAACGGSAPTAPSAPQPTVLTVNNAAPGLGYFRQDVAIFRDGTINATLNWSNPTKDLDLYLTNDRCEWNVGPCTILSKSELFTGSREQVTTSVVSGQTYRLWIINTAATAENFNLEVVVQ